MLCVCLLGKQPSSLPLELLCVLQNAETPLITPLQLLSVLQNGLNEVEQFLTRQGLNSQTIVSSTKEVTSKAEGAINYAAPTVKSTASTLSTTDPQVLARYGAIGAGVYFLVRSHRNEMLRSLQREKVNCFSDFCKLPNRSPYL